MRMYIICAIAAGLVSIAVLTPMVACGQALSGFEHHALAGATVSLPAAAFVLSANPAAISGHSLYWFGNRHFGMDALQEGGLSYQQSVDKNSFLHGYALEIHHFGFDLYRELQWKSGMAVHVGKSRFGLSAGLLHHQISGYGSSLTLVTDVGFQHLLHDDVILGAAMRNLELHQSGSFLSGVQSSGTVGISYTPVNNLQVSIAAAQYAGYRPDLHVGTTYLFEELSVVNLLLATGYSTVYEQWSGGAAMTFQRLYASYTIENHPALGITYGIGFGYSW